jgi:RNA recognition motif-containing protein
MQSEDTRTLFIGDLSVYCTEQNIENLFLQFGQIEKITIKRGASGSTNLSYGFIKFYQKESAEAAACMNGFVFLGRAMR